MHGTEVSKASRRAACLLGSLSNRTCYLKTSRISSSGREFATTANPFDSINFVTPSMLQELPVDHSDEKLQRTPRTVQNAFAAIVDPTPLSEPILVSFSPPAAELLDLNPEDIRANTRTFAECFAGNFKMKGTGLSYAHCYGGSQFGSWAGQLGDGRAITIGEVMNKKQERWEVSLKGSGLTPFSRFADGRAVLRSSIREYLASEALAALNIPTTRALSLISSADKTARDEFYNGNIKYETCAVVCRLAPTFIRFGSLELFYMRGEMDNVQKLLDFIIKYHYPEIQNSSENRAEVYEKFFLEVVHRTARLVSMWQSVGFAHGVLNTDNMSILGWTIDYGPYGFLDAYEPNFIPNHSDYGGRYRYINQPSICKWNLAKLGRSILPLLPSMERAQQALETYDGTFLSAYHALMRRKLGFMESLEGDEDVVVGFLDLLESSKADYSRSFRLLSTIKKNDPDSREEHAFVETLSGNNCRTDAIACHNWLSKYRKRLQNENISDSQRKEMMDSVNPKFVLRNHLAQRAISSAEAGDYSEVNKLLDILMHPFDEQPQVESFFSEPPPKDSPKICVSCSS